MKEIARDLAIVPGTIANAYLVGNRACWVLVDSGVPGGVGKIRHAAEARFGPASKPRAILLTHGHFDHAGSAAGLADAWRVPIYAHRLEMPYLTGKSKYPPLDRTAPGFFSGLSRVFPSSTVNLGGRLRVMNESGPAPEIADWECIYTPGHTPGHVAFFRKSDGALLAGDAVTTMNLDSFVGTIAKRPEVCRPPVPATTDWEQARLSARTLATLRPSVIAAGHGSPLRGAEDELQALADSFPIPVRGRYAVEPARADETGVTYLPPAPFDPLPRIAAGLAAGLAIAGIAAVAARKRNPTAGTLK